MGARRGMAVIVPAYNEEKMLADTLAHVASAAAAYASDEGGTVELIVVDNNSDDATAEIAVAAGARVVTETERGIGRARNAGAQAASAPWLFFLDADTTILPPTLEAIGAALAKNGCQGGSVATIYHPRRWLLRVYARAWQWYADRRQMTQGIAQFATEEAFEAIGGYDVELFMGEDNDFHWRLAKYARKQGGHVARVTEPAVFPSMRRMDEWPTWKTLLWTNPLTVALFRRSPRFWSRWYERTVR